MIKSIFNNHIIPFVYKEALIINNGILSYKELIKKKYNINSLMYELKKKKINRIEDVEYAFLKNNGIISIYEKEELPIPLIVDGKINNITLKILKKNNVWIKNILNNEHIRLEEVFYAFYKKDKVYIIKNDGRINSNC
ncbi:MAG TPA: DUF421 domain-containing protein [Mollicutes bacterium]|nr:DUF421 domain-containing protein [Mollicutes bacterium]